MLLIGYGFLITEIFGFIFLPNPFTPFSTYPNGPSTNCIFLSFCHTFPPLFLFLFFLLIGIYWATKKKSPIIVNENI